VPLTGFTVAAQQIVGKPDSYGLRPESKACSAALSRFCQQGAGARLARDLPATGSDATGQPIVCKPGPHGLRPESKQNVGQPDPTVYGQNHKLAAQRYPASVRRA